MASAQTVRMMNRGEKNNASVCMRVSRKVAIPQNDENVHPLMYHGSARFTLDKTTVLPDLFCPVLGSFRLLLSTGDAMLRVLIAALLFCIATPSLADIISRAGRSPAIARSHARRSH